MLERYTVNIEAIILVVSQVEVQATSMQDSLQEAHEIFRKDLSVDVDSSHDTTFEIKSLQAFSE